MKREKEINMIACIVFAALLNVSCFAGQVLTRSEFIEKAEGMWLGQIAANMAGRSTEGNYSGSAANPSESVDWVLKGPGESWPGDDDTDVEYVALHILEEHGFDASGSEIASQWLTHITTSGIYISNRQALFLMGDGVLPPETGSRKYNQHWYSIDSQITTEVLGVVSPGMVQEAIGQAYKFASVSNEGFPVHATQFQVAMYSYAFFESDVNKLVAKSMAVMPESSRSYQVVSDVVSWYEHDMADGVADWRATRRKLYDNYGSGSLAMGRYNNWIESTVNLGATVMCLLYGQGDYKETVRVGVLAGWDCDCNPAIAGGILGVIYGRSGMPQDLFGDGVCSNTYENLYRPYLPDPEVYRPQYEDIYVLANRIADLAEQNIIANGGNVVDDVYSIVESGDLVIQPEQFDPEGPGGLVKAAVDAGMTVVPVAAVANYNAGTDLYNLNGIIDGIKDNSYNGVRPYRSYSAAGIGRTEDYYGVRFSGEVVFDAVTFYEGDTIWTRINDYNRTNERKGGHFEDLRVEVYRDGVLKLVEGASFSEGLDKDKMYQVITISFEPVTGDEIRVVGRPGGTETYTTILELEVSGRLELCGDINGDMKIDLVDFGAIAGSWLTEAGENGYASQLDCFADNIIDIKDLSEIYLYWLR